MKQNVLKEQARPESGKDELAKFDEKIQVTITGSMSKYDPGKKEFDWMVGAIVGVAKEPN